MAWPPAVDAWSFRWFRPMVSGNQSESFNMISGRKQSFHVATIVNRAASAMPGTEIEPMITADTALRPGKRNFVKA